ncbi:MAG: flagellin FliC [Candidatus Dadabacteria bacterium]|nr:MAG: flagellin FliC [Candidatus Dadabacteria bacterium]
MTINIRTNIASLTAQRNLAQATERLTTSFERLSSGLRINRARDDAAGLAIAESLKADTKIATVAIRNASDGISIISIADQAIGQINNVLSRLAELAEQSANGVFSITQRSALQNEFSALASEIERIAITTEFNGLKLLSGGGEVVFQVGFDGSSNSRVTYSGVQATLAAIGLAGSGSSALIYSINASTEAAAQTAARLALDAVNNAITSLTRNRGQLGAAESRLQVTISNLQVARENFQAAESRIRDADVANEAAELARLTILQQAGAAVLAQANAQPQLALRLLT